MARTIWFSRRKFWFSHFWNCEYPRLPLIRLLLVGNIKFARYLLFSFLLLNKFFDRFTIAQPKTTIWSKIFKKICIGSKQYERELIIPMILVLRKKKQFGFKNSPLWKFKPLITRRLRLLVQRFGPGDIGFSYDEPSPLKFPTGVKYLTIRTHLAKRTDVTWAVEYANVIAKKKLAFALPA